MVYFNIVLVTIILSMEKQTGVLKKTLPANIPNWYDSSNQQIILCFSLYCTSIKSRFFLLETNSYNVHYKNVTASNYCSMLFILNGLIALFDDGWKAR